MKLINRKTGPRHQEATSLLQGQGILMGCLGLFAIFSLLSLALAILAAIERIAMTILHFIGITIATIAVSYIGALLLTITAGPVLDVIRRRIELAEMRKKAWKNSIRSPFPKHELLQDERYLDSIVWHLIDSFLGRETVRIRRSFRSYRSKCRRIAELGEMRLLLLESPDVFADWWRVNLPKVVSDQANQTALTGVYNTVLKRVRDECWGRLPSSPLLEVVGFTILRDTEPLTKWYLTRNLLILLTKGKISDKGITALQHLGTEDQIRGRVRSYLADGTRFREFLDQYFFEIMGELGPFEFCLPKVHKYYRHEQIREDHYMEPEPKLWRLLPARTQTSVEAEKLESHRVRAERLTRDAKERLERTKRLRKKYRLPTRPGVIFSLFCEEKTGLEPDIKNLLEVLYPRHSGEKLVALRSDSRAFIDFWSTHETDLLEAHDDRITAQSATTPHMEHERWREETAQQALVAHRSEQGALRETGYAAIDYEFGLLLAQARQQIRAELTGSEHVQLDNYLERVLGELLQSTDSQDKFFGDDVRQSLHECEEFRQGRLAYGEQILALGHQPTMDRDVLALAFVENAPRWRKSRQIAPSQSLVKVEPESVEQPDEASASKKAVQPRQRRLPPKRSSKPESRANIPTSAFQKGNVLLTEKDAAEHLQMSPRALQAWRYQGRGPKYVRISGRAVRYRQDDLREWIALRLRSSTSESDPQD